MYDIINKRADKLLKTEKRVFMEIKIKRELEEIIEIPNHLVLDYLEGGDIAENIVNDLYNYHENIFEKVIVSENIELIEKDYKEANYIIENDLFKNGLEYFYFKEGDPHYKFENNKIIFTIEEGKGLKIDTFVLSLAKEEGKHFENVLKFDMSIEHNDIFIVWVDLGKMEYYFLEEISKEKRREIIQNNLGYFVEWWV